MKKSLWTCHDLLRITKGELEFSDGLSKNDWYVTGVSIDTRTLKPGDLFIALKDRRDGHEFVEDALKKGASAAMIEKRLNKKINLPLLLVSNVINSNIIQFSCEHSPFGNF